MNDEKKSDVQQNDIGRTYKLQHDAYPKVPVDVTDFIKTDYDEAVVANNGKDRRQRKNTLPMIIQSGCDAVDISKYIVQLQTQYANQLIYGGSGTIIGIFQNKLFLLTCAHNVIKFGHAENIWFLFDNKHVSATTVHAFPKYNAHKNNEIINDLAIIECKLSQSFLFYHIFPVLKSLSAGDYHALIYGYPLIPPDKKGGFWGMEGTIKCNQKEILSYSEIDTTGGQSGSPIIVNGEIVGVHTTGNLGRKENYGPALTQEKIQWINRLMYPTYYNKMDENKATSSQILQEKLAKQENEWRKSLNNLEMKCENEKKELQIQWELWNNRLKYYNPNKKMAVTIQSKYHKKYWCAGCNNDNQISCNAKEIGPWEVFSSHPCQGANKVAFKSRHGTWAQIKMHNNGKGIHALSGTVKEWELFQLHVVNAEKNEYAIECYNKKLISSRAYGLNASKTNYREEAEVFIIQPLN